MTSATQTEDNRMWVVMAWALQEHAEAIDVMEGCLMACEASPEEAYDEIGRQIEALGQTIEEYDIILRDPQK